MAVQSNEYADVCQRHRAKKFRQMNEQAHNLSNMQTKGGRRRDEPLSAFVRSRLIELLRKTTVAELSKKYGIPQSGISQVRNGRLGVGLDLAERYAPMLGFPSTGNLVDAAATWWEVEGRQQSVGAVPAAREGERYLSMPVVRAAAQSDGIPVWFVDSFERRLEVPGQPVFGVLYGLLKSQWDASPRHAVAPESAQRRAVASEIAKSTTKRPAKATHGARGSIRHAQGESRRKSR